MVGLEQALSTCMYGRRPLCSAMPNESFMVGPWAGVAGSEVFLRLPLGRAASGWAPPHRTPHA